MEENELDHPHEPEKDNLGESLGVFSSSFFLSFNSSRLLSVGSIALESRPRSSSVDRSGKFVSHGPEQRDGSYTVIGQLWRSFWIPQIWLVGIQLLPTRLLVWPRNFGVVIWYTWPLCVQLQSL